MTTTNSTMTMAKNGSTTLGRMAFALAAAMAFALTACGGAGDSSDGAQTSATVGAAGGTLRAGSATLTVPAGALSSDVQVTLREAAPQAGRAARVEIEPRGLALGQAGVLAVRVDDSNGRVRMMRVDDGPEHAVQVELEDRVHHLHKTVVTQFGVFEVEIEHGRVCSPGCAASEECDDGLCKPHLEHLGTGVACDSLCASGLECDDGFCKPHGGADDGLGVPATCSPGCASGLECDDGICKPHGGANGGGLGGATCSTACAAGLECEHGVCVPHRSGI
jgi:hypothetical protein